MIRLLENQNFKDIKKTEVYDDSEPGTIIKQNPEAVKKLFLKIQF